MDPVNGPSGDQRILGDPPPAPSRNNNGLGRDEFLHLLIVQLKNQSPLSPQGNTEFIAQMAQFSALDELVAIKDLLRSIERRIGPPDGPRPPVTP